LKGSAPLPFHGCELLAHARLESNEENARSRGPYKACDSGSQGIIILYFQVGEAKKDNKNQLGSDKYMI
jgi:hypothetical protein